MIRKTGNSRNLITSYLQRSSVYERRNSITPLQEALETAAVDSNEPLDGAIRLPEKGPTPAITKRGEQLLPGFADQNFL